MSPWVCDNCGHDMLYDRDLEGITRPLKVQGWLIDEKGESYNICSICVQVESTINKESLYERGFRRLLFGSIDSPREEAKYEYEILPEEPYLRKVSLSKEVEI